MSKHAFLSPSGSHRWLNCTPSAMLESEFPGGSSSAAEEGTAAHAFCEHKLKKALRRRSKRPVSDYDSDEMQEYTDSYVDYVLEQLEVAKQICKDPMVLIEQKVDFSEYVPDGYGTADCIIVSDDTMQIIDFKYGLGVLVDAEQNTQLMCYSIGALNLFDSLYDIKQVTMHTKEKLEALKTAAEQANTALANGDITKEQYDALQREIIETEAELKKLETQANQSATAVQKIASAGEKMKTAGDNISSAGQKMLPVTAAVTGLGTAAVTTAANFESSMSQVQATMGITKDAMSTVDGQTVNTMDTLNELAKKMGSETAFSASECAQALNYLALAGYDTQQMCDTLPTVLNLAAAGDIDLASASDMVTDAMSALGMEVSEAGTMVDQMAKTASSTNTSVAQLGEGILTIGATAKSVKGGTAELNTALGILANNGIKGAEGGTHLRNIILSLQNPTDKAADAMNSLGLSVYDSEGNMRSMNDILGDLNTAMDGMTGEEKSNIISKIFNKTDLSSVNALLANTGDTWDELQQSITNSGGAAQQMADTQLDNLQGQLTILKSALEGLAISLGELLMPYIKMIVGWIQSFVDWLNSLDEGTQKIIVTIALVAAAVGPILIIVGKVISAVGTIMTIVPKVVSLIKGVQSAFALLNTTMLANPIMLIIAAIAALVAAFIYLWNTNEGFRQFWIDLWENIKNAVTVAVEAVGQFLTAAWEFIKTTAETVWNAIAGFFTTIWEGIKNTVSTVVNAIKTTITNIFNAIKTTVTTIITAIHTTMTTIFTNIWTSITTTVGNIKNAIVNGLTAAFNFIKSIPGQALQWGKDKMVTSCGFLRFTW